MWNRSSGHSIPRDRQPRCASLSLSACALVRFDQRAAAQCRVALRVPPQPSRGPRAAIARPSSLGLLAAARAGSRRNWFVYRVPACSGPLHHARRRNRSSRGVDPECEWIGRSSKDYGMTSVSNHAPLTVRSCTQPLFDAQPPYFDSSIFLWRVGPRICTIAAKPHVQHHLLNNSSPWKNI